MKSRCHGNMSQLVKCVPSGPEDNLLRHVPLRVPCRLDQAHPLGCIHGAARGVSTRHLQKETDVRSYLFVLNLFLIQVWSNYNVVLPTAIQQSDSFISFSYFSPHMAYHRILNRVPWLCSRGRCCLSFPYITSLHLLTPNSNPTLYHPHPLATTSLFSESLLLLLFHEAFICAIFYIPHVSDIAWSPSFSV